MPNHIATKFSVSGTPAEIDDFIKAARHEYPDGSSIFAIESFYPCPAELRKTTSPTKVVSQEEYEATLKKNEEEKDKCFQQWPITEAMQKDYKERFGHDNWYDWQVANWGTKWGCYDVVGESQDTWHRHDDGDTSSYIWCYYNTAWSPATEALRQISQQFPNLEFRHAFSDEGGNYLGYEVLQDGQITDQGDYNWSSPEGKAFREEEGIHPPSEYDDEEEEEDTE